MTEQKLRRRHYSPDNTKVEDFVHPDRTDDQVYEKRKRRLKKHKSQALKKQNNNKTKDAHHNDTQNKTVQGTDPTAVGSDKHDAQVKQFEERFNALQTFNEEIKTVDEVKKVEIPEEKTDVTVKVVKNVQDLHILDENFKSSQLQRIRENFRSDQAKNDQYLARMFNNNNLKTGGRCCCRVFGNQRGSRLVHILDLIIFFHILRFPIALMAYFNKKYFPSYAKIRKITFYLHLIVAIIAFIVLLGLYLGDFNFIEILYTLGLLPVCGVVALVFDYHFTQVISFRAQNNNISSRERPIQQWWMSDSELPYTFQNDPKAPENEGQIAQENRIELMYNLQIESQLAKLPLPENISSDDEIKKDKAFQLDQKKMRNSQKLESTLTTTSKLNMDDNNLDFRTIEKKAQELRQKRSAPKRPSIDL